MKSIDVVSNTSPLIFLEKIDCLPLLKKCFNTVFIPERVKVEWGETHIPDYISIRPVSESGMGYVMGAVGRLHQGELEAIQLALELNCKIVLLDDLLARQFAERKDLVPLGVLGILKLAHQLEFISFEDVKSKVATLINDHGLFISQNILNQYFESF